MVALPKEKESQLPSAKVTDLPRRTPQVDVNSSAPLSPARAEPSLAEVLHEKFLIPFLKLMRATRATIIFLCLALHFCIKTCLRYLIHHPMHAVFNACVLLILTVVTMTGSDIHDQVILGEISGKTVERVIDASRFTRSFRSPETSPSGDREFLRVGAPEWMQKEAVRAVLFHARKAGLSVEHQAVLLATVEVESGFNPMARAATTTACGLFQFVKRTGEVYDLSRDECMNPWLNAQAGVKHYIDNYEDRVAPKVVGLHGVEKVFQTYELTYYMHHDGPNYSEAGSNVKAVVLSGTQFLLKVYNVLQEEQFNRQSAPTFGERFAENLWGVLHDISQLFGHQSEMVANDAARDEAGDEEEGLA